MPARRLRCSVLVTTALMVVLGLAAPSVAGLLPEGWEEHVKPIAQARLRGELVDWFRPADVAGAPVDNRYGFFGSRYRLGLAATWPNVEFVLLMQETILANVPSDAIAPQPAGALGTGAAYFQNTASTFQQEPFLKTGFVRVRRSGLALTLGRFDVRGGLESVPANATLAFVKESRIAERLVGPFEFTHVSRSFDGGLVSYDRPAWNVTAFGAVPTQGGFEISANPEIDDMVLAGAALTGKRLPELDVPVDASLFYLYYGDARTTPVKVDNRPLPEREADHLPIHIHTVGSHALALVTAGPGDLDLLLWGVLQTGSWGELEHRAWAWAAEAGYQLPRVPTTPWLRIGWNRSSGDGDPFDSRHDSFFQILPTARRYAQLPFFNLMNDDDLFAELLLRPLPQMLVRADVHHLALTESADLWYSGGGANNDRLFGYAGIPSGGSRELAWLVDLSLDARVLDWLGVGVYVGHAFGRSVVASTFPGSDVTYGYLEMTIALP